MPQHTFQLDPAYIIVRRDQRQRKDISNTEELQNSIKLHGLINPIVVRHEDDKTILVAGERRLSAILALGLETVDVRFMEDMTADEARIIELEENIKREDLPWRDMVLAIGTLHSMFQSKDKTWTQEQTAEHLSCKLRWISYNLTVYECLTGAHPERIAQAPNIETAYNTIVRFAERKAENIVQSIIANGVEVFGDKIVAKASPPVIEATAHDFDEPPTAGPVSPQGPSLGSVSVVAKAQAPAAPIICTDFLSWIKDYKGIKFSFLHCDFPYGNYKGDDTANADVEVQDFYANKEDVYWRLLDGLVDNLDRIMSHSAHVMFWFNMNFYSETVAKLTKAGLFVHPHPLIWHKSDGKGVVPGNVVTHPRRLYDTSLLCVRGSRILARPGGNSYSCPSVTNKIHPSQKPEPMLRYFMSMIVDETTTMFDPTCGSGASLRAAEDLGAKLIVGLELDPVYAKSANKVTQAARVLRTTTQRKD